MKHNNNFALIRLLAAAQSVFMHCYAHLHLPANGALFWAASQFPGVACFFVISGFLVSDSFLRSDTVGSFFFKRALRIYPALIANILVLELLMFLAGQMPGVTLRYPVYLAAYVATASSTLGTDVAKLALYQFLPNDFFQGYPSQVLWTLTVELSFYVVLPLFLWLVSRSKAAGTAVIVAAMAVSFSVAFKADMNFYNQHARLEISVIPYFWVFGLGVLARLHWDFIAALFRGKFFFWLIAHAVITAISIKYFRTNEWLDYKLLPMWPGFFRTLLMSAVVLSAAFSSREFSERAGLNKIDLSYGLYLWHMLIVMTLIGFGLTAQWWLWLVVYIGGLMLAAASWFLVEKPAQKLKTWTRKPKPRLAAAE